MKIFPAPGNEKLRCLAVPSISAFAGSTTTYLSHPNCYNESPRKMASSSTAIPRFLLPKLSWRDATPSSIALASLGRPQHVKGPPSWTKPVRRSVSTAPPCQYHRTSCSYRNSYSSTFQFKSLIFSPSYGNRRCFSATPSFYRDHHFDTLKFVQRLKDEGFSEEQSKAMMLVLSDVIEESIQNLTRTMVLREGIKPVLFQVPGAI